MDMLFSKHWTHSNTEGVVVTEMTHIYVVCPRTYYYAEEDQSVCCTAIILFLTPLTLNLTLRSQSGENRVVR